ncbi:MAG: tRNA (adenosine(37)-N6)-dimethylallyltransferase, partial [Flavobacteriaceae bacterium]
MDKTLIAVVGPTAIGKTSWAIRLAKYFDTEIVSADSRQFYKEMKIGTAVPSDIELAEVPHHFIQNRSIAEPWSVGDYERAAVKLLAKIFKKKNVVIAVGGSGLYI